MENNSVIIIIIIIIGFCLLLFLILRELACWYLKINERIELQKETNSLLKGMLRELKGSVPGNVDKNNTEEIKKQ